MQEHSSLSIYNLLIGEQNLLFNSVQIHRAKDETIYNGSILTCNILELLTNLDSNSHLVHQCYHIPCQAVLSLSNQFAVFSLFKIFPLSKKDP